MKKLIPDIKYEDLPEKEVEDGYLYLMKTPTKISIKHYKPMMLDYFDLEDNSDVIQAYVDLFKISKFPSGMGKVKRNG